MTEHAIIAPAPRTRRLATRVLRGTADLIDTLSVVALAAVAFTSLAGSGPQWAQLSPAGLVVAGLALYGLAHLAGAVFGGIAKALDPDTREGDVAKDAAALLGDLSSHVDNGADTRQVLDNLRTSGLVPRLRTVMTSLAVTFAEEGDHMESQRLLRAVGHLNFVDRAVNNPQD